MFDGLFGPWHLLMIALVLLVFVAPGKIADRVRGTAESVQRLVDPDEHPTVSSAEAVAAPRPTLSYRLGRRLRRRPKR